MYVEFVEEALSPRLQCESISAMRRLHCNDPTGVSIIQRQGLSSRKILPMK